MTKYGISLDVYKILFVKTKRSWQECWIYFGSLCFKTLLKSLLWSWFILSMKTMATGIKWKHIIHIEFWFHSVNEILLVSNIRLYFCIIFLQIATTNGVLYPWHNTGYPSIHSGISFHSTTISPWNNAYQGILSIIVDYHWT